MKTRNLLVLILLCASFSSAHMDKDSSKMSDLPATAVHVPSSSTPHTSLYNHLLFESFENGFPPSGWKKISNGTADEEWNLASDDARSGFYSAKVSFSPKDRTMDEWLVSPAINFSQVKQAFLQFYELGAYWGDGIHHYIMVSTTSQTNVSSFTTLLDMTPQNHAINGFVGEPVEIDLSAFKGKSTLYIAFRYVGTWADIWLIDDVDVYAANNHDVKATVLNMNKHHEKGSTTYPSAIVKNVGLNSESFKVEFGYFDWSGNPVIVDTKDIANLASGQTKNTEFKSISFQGEMQRRYFTRTKLTRDEDVSNDWAYKNVDSFSKKKNRVLLEKGTGTWCPYCPGSARAVDSLQKTHSNQIAVIEYHASDDFETASALQRLRYYRIKGYPTVFFNGIHEISGGAKADADWSGIYNSYVQQLSDCLAEKTGFALELSCKITGNKVDATAQITYLAEVLINSHRLFYALVESSVTASWFGLDSVHDVFRNMNSDDGKIFYAKAQTPFVQMKVADAASFNIPPTSTPRNYQLIAFIQEMDSKEVLAAAKVDLKDVMTFVTDKNADTAPEHFILLQNYPNPFNGGTWVAIENERSRNIQVSIFNLRGQMIRQVYSGLAEIGVVRYYWDGFDADNQDVPSGLYHIQVQSEDDVKTIKTVKLR